MQLPKVRPHYTEPKSIATQLMSTLLSAGLSEIRRQTYSWEERFLASLDKIGVGSLGVAFVLTEN